MFCAGFPRRKIDSCKVMNELLNQIIDCEDSGGPLVKKINDNYFVAGIVSFGFECGTMAYASVYTNVSNYVNWIKKHTNI
ncbi:serine protease 33-like protein [Leptotrombidium deliense]|uniref:Serine protease 33-like protein n=1 Tax=Leptotrombidium deliense TaxID=299467 RepID=A0A443RTZ9_9ACAR|nr:serine protease 33-like protein [Leptotrombidium deliense]